MKNHLTFISFLKIISSLFLCVFLMILIPYIVLDNGNSDDKKYVSQYNISSKNIIFNNGSDGCPIINIYITKDKKIEQLYLEEYVRGVIAGEMPAEFEIEALKAQAVAARTYALAHMEAFGGTKSDAAYGGDVCDTVENQVYMTKAERIKSWPAKKAEDYWNKITKAVEDSAGEVITYSGELVLEPYYFAVSSGRTEDAAQVLSMDVPYLKSVSSPGDKNAKNYKTSMKISYADMVNKINQKYPNAEVSKAKLKSQVIIKAGRTSGGSVEKVVLGNITITGIAFRSVFNLHSSDFTIKFNTNNVEIDCIGYGHGIGMSQWGANAMAKAGSKYSDILTHYYQGVALKKMDWKEQALQ